MHPAQNCARTCPGLNLKPYETGLARLGLGGEVLATRYPRLCRVQIVGDTRAPDVAGHDLTCQAEAGLLDAAQPTRPSTLVADLTGSREAFAAALALLLGRERGHTERGRTVGCGTRRILRPHRAAWARPRRAESCRARRRITACCAPPTAGWPPPRWNRISGRAGRRRWAGT